MQVEEEHLLEEFEHIGRIIVHKTAATHEQPILISSSYVYNLLSFNPNDKYPPPLLIDTRKSEDFESKFIRNSINLPLDETEDELPEHVKYLERHFKKDESRRRCVYSNLYLM